MGSNPIRSGLVNDSSASINSSGTARAVPAADLVPLAPPSLRTIDGFVGVFTPIAEQGKEDSPDAQKNLQQIIDRLTQEVGTLQKTNRDLQDRIDKLLAPAKSPDDLASALQRTVDRLQSELASLSNPVSNFAVKEFLLETTLTVSITELGTIEYRLLQPGSNVDPSSISKLTLSLVPIEKQKPEGTLTPLLFQPNKELSLIGMNDGLRQLLEQNHIFTIGEFRSVATRAQVRAALIASETTTQKGLALLQARAELVLLADIDLNIANTLIAANIDSLQALARSTPESLLLILKDVDKAQLARWITAAQTFTGVVPADRPQHSVVISTDPPSLCVRLGTSGLYAPVAITQQLPASQPVTFSTFRRQLQETGAGYELTGWSTGGSLATTTVQSPGDIKATAHFQVACYSVSAATVSPGGKVTLVPATGGLAGFPAHCYAVGTTVQVVVAPESGFLLKGLAITTGGTTQTVTTLSTSIVVNGPVTARATFVPQATRPSVEAGSGGALPLPGRA